MKLWIASANKEVLEKSYQFPLTGIITNPSVIALEKKPWQETFKDLNEFNQDKIHIQVISTKEEEILREVEEYSRVIDKERLIVKIPMSVGGLKTVPFLKSKGFEINITGVCTMAQAVLALETDIDYISVYLARINDSGRDGLLFIRQVMDYIKRIGKTTQIIAASVRNKEQLDEVINVGADAIAITYELLEEMSKDIVTDNSIHNFKLDWDKII
jgi:TalC/MipB family fructose-6-phosphate aldolase